MSESKVASREEILAGLGRRRFETVTIGEQTYRLRSLLEREFSPLTVGIDDDDDVLDRQRQLLALCLCDGDGNPLFTIDEAYRLAELDQQTATILFDVCKRLTGVTRPKN